MDYLRGSRGLVFGLSDLRVIIVVAKTGGNRESFLDRPVETEISKVHPRLKENER